MRPTVLSLGGGVQSTVMALSLTEKYYDHRIASQLGNPLVIMADTGSEKEETMEYIKNIVRPALLEENIPFHIIKSEKGNLHEYYYSINKIPRREFRNCTMDFKIDPIVQHIKKIGLKRKIKQRVRMAIGISTDEIHRMKENPITWIDNVYPLIEANFSREDCIKWFKERNLPIPVKSGCFLCPFNRKSEWIDLMKNKPELINIAVDLENNARLHSPNNKKITLYRENLPLANFIKEKSIANLEENSLLDDWNKGDECSGSCFL